MKHAVRKTRLERINAGGNDGRRRPPDTNSEGSRREGAATHEPLVHLLDADEQVLQGLGRFMQAAGYRTAGHTSVEAFWETWLPGEPGALITELYLHGGSGIELQRRIRARADPLPVIFITAHGDVETAVCALREGASGFLTKPFSKQELLENLRNALAADEVARRERARQRHAAALLNSLSMRESEVMHLITAGCKNREIAARLDIGLKTVEMHRSNLMKKLRADNIVDLLQLAFVAGRG